MPVKNAIKLIRVYAKPKDQMKQPTGVAALHSVWGFLSIVERTQYI